VARAVKVRTLGGILALAVSLTGCASGVDGAGVVGNEASSGAGGAGISSVVPLPPTERQFGGRDNLVPNGSFERGPWPWVPFTGARNLTLTRAHKFGKFALLVRPRTKASAVGVADLNFAAKPAPGSRYSFSAWVRGPQGGPPALAGVELAVLKAHRSTWTQIGAKGRPVSGNWQLLTATGTVPKGNPVILRVTVSLNDVSPGTWLAIDGVDAKIVKPGTSPNVGS
jgi:hypothetical protein